MSCILEIHSCVYEGQLRGSLVTSHVVRRSVALTSITKQNKTCNSIKTMNDLGIYQKKDTKDLCTENYKEFLR